jgi:hypothetical protein
MTNIKLTLLAAAAFGVVSIGGASALPFSNSTPSVGESDVQLARVVCDRFGRCWNTNRSSRSTRYYYAPASPGYAYGSYGAYDRRYDSPGIGVGVGPYGIWVR